MQLPLNWQRVRHQSVNLAILVCAGALTYFAQLHDRHISAALLFLLGVMFVGARSGLVSGLSAALLASLAYNFFLSEPTYQFGVTTLDEIVPLVAFNATAILTGGLAGRQNDVAKAARRAERRNEFLLQVSELLQNSFDLDDVERMVRQALPFQHIEDVELYRFEEGALIPVSDSAEAGEIVAGLTAGTDTQIEQAGWKIYRLSGSQPTLGAAAFRLRERRSSDLVDERGLVSLIVLAIERIILMRQLAEMEAVKRSEELKTIVLASLSHDLRSPLTAIEASATSLGKFRAQLSPQDQEGMLRNILNQCSRLNRYAANLLNLGMIEGGISDGSLEDVDLIEILAATITRVSAAFPEVAIKRDFGTKSAIVRAHPVMLEQLLHNVVENACLHGGGSAVCVSTRSEGPNAVVRVRDDGPGVPVEHQASLFRRFYRVPSDQKPPGSGLGLYIARAFATAFDGEVELTSPAAEGRGTVVTIRLPLLGIEGQVAP